MEPIRSRTNQKAKAIRKVRDRKIDGCFFVEGLRLTGELLNSNIEVLELIVAEDFIDRSTELIDKLTGLGADLCVVSRDVLSSVSETKSPQGIAAVCATPDTGKAKFEELLKPDGKYVMLHGVSNPGNLGTVLRTAEAFGTDGIVLTSNSTDPFHPVSVRGSMGSVFRLPIWTNAGFDDALQTTVSHGLAPILIDAAATDSVKDADWKKGRLVVFGSEAEGLTADERSGIKESCSVPMNGPVESLNLGVAAGIVLFLATNDAEN